MRCARCGNENSDSNRYCGMCGASMLPAPAAAAQRVTTPSNPPATTAARPVATEKPVSARVSNDSPSISGPSFLGLNDPAPRKRASLSLDPHSSPSSNNLDYLLDDEHEHRGGGAGKIVLILVALALAAGLGYLRWKNHGFGWLGLSSNKPSAVAQDSGATDASPSGAAAPDTVTGPQAPIANQPAASAAPSQPDSAPTSANSSPNPANPATITPRDTTPTSSQPATSMAPANPENAKPAATPKEPAPDTNDSTDTPVAKDSKPKAAKPAPAPKPSAAAAATKPAPPPTDTVAEARKYLYGKGAAQDCERGLRLLKPAANQSNPKAMIEMGALYSAGLCTPHDLPTAYRWFALALRKDPENDAVQADLQKLWGEMTQPERQLAIKLSQ